MNWGPESGPLGNDHEPIKDKLMGDSRLTAGDWQKLADLTYKAAQDVGRPEHDIFKALELTHAFANAVLSHNN